MLVAAKGGVPRRDHKVVHACEYGVIRGHVRNATAVRRRHEAWASGPLKYSLRAPWPLDGQNKNGLLIKFKGALKILYSRHLASFDEKNKKQELFTSL